MDAPHWTTRRAQIVIPPRRQDVVVNPIDDEAAVTDPRNGNTYHLNPTALAVWRQCDGKTTTRRIARQLTRHYDVTFETALDDVEQLVALFASSQLVMSSGEPR